MHRRAQTVEQLGAQIERELPGFGDELVNGHAHERNDAVHGETTLSFRYGTGRDEVSGAPKARRLLCHGGKTAVGRQLDAQDAVFAERHGAFFEAAGRRVGDQVQALGAA